MSELGGFESTLRSGLAVAANRIEPPAGLAEQLIGAPAGAHHGGHRGGQRVRPAAVVVVVVAMVVVTAIAIGGYVLGVTMNGHHGAASGGADPVYTQPGLDPHLPDSFCPAQPPVRSPSAATARITVDPGPSSVIAVWFPGTNRQPCSGGPSNGGEGIAQQIAADIRTAPARPSGAYSCPADDGEQVALYFSYPGNKTETVTVTLSGCPTIIAAGRGPDLQVTQKLTNDLQTLKPPPWR